MSWPFHAAQVQRFDLFSGPGIFSQKFQAGFDTGIIRETLDSDAFSHFTPAVMLHQVGQDHFQRDTVQRIVRLGFAHGFHQ
jgi:hypothetical protein